MSRQYSNNVPPGWRKSISNYAGRTLPSVDRVAGVMVLLAPGEHGPDVLFTQRALDLNSHPGEVSFPGGNVEPEDIDLYATSLRETQEEVGLIDLPVRLGRLDALYARSGILVEPHVGWLDQKPSLTACPDEVAEIFWVPLVELYARPPEYQLFERNGRHWRVPFFYYGPWKIWGMTGMITVNLINVIWQQAWPSFHEEWGKNPMDDNE